MDTEYFYQKNTINLYKKLTDKDNTILDLSKGQKQEIVNILIDKMKSVYKSIDLNKVTKKNFKSILTQFNNLSFEESYNELAKMKLIKKSII